MASVYLLWFEQERGAGKDLELLIGVYASESEARALAFFRVVSACS